MSDVRGRDNPLSSLILGEGAPPVVRDAFGEIDLFAFGRLEVVGICSIAIASRLAQCKIEKRVNVNLVLQHFYRSDEGRADCSRGVGLNLLVEHLSGCDDTFG